MVFGWLNKETQADVFCYETDHRCLVELSVLDCNFIYGSQGNVSHMF